MRICGKLLHPDVENCRNYMPPVISGALIRLEKIRIGANNDRETCTCFYIIAKLELAFKLLNMLL